VQFLRRGEAVPKPPTPLPEPAVNSAGVFPGWLDSSARQAGPTRACSC
jgi:hypothetical protein